MSEEKIPVATIGGLAILGSGVVGTLYLGYKYFVEPGNLILAQYRYILEDIYKETKKFLEQNANLEPPIYGLTAGQEAIIQAKEDVAEKRREEVEEILAGRGLDVNAWVTEVIIGVLIVWAAKEILPVLLDQLRAWRQKPEADSIQSSHGHTHLLFEIITNEMAGIGRLDIASGFQLGIQSYYSSFSEPAINAQIGFYNSLLPTLIPGTLEYIATVSLLSYLTFEVSAVGIMGSLWNFWMV